jgi:hypothetical protein
MWSNRELRKIAGLFRGDVVNVSGRDDRDKEGGRYREYFSNASRYLITNFTGDYGRQGLEQEIFVDLTEDLPGHLRGQFDVVFNHTTLEHVFRVETAFRNLCLMSRDVVIVVVPFCQTQHERAALMDYWRFTPRCVRGLFAANGFEAIYQSETGRRNAGSYIFTVATLNPDRWRETLPPFREPSSAGNWIGWDFTVAAVCALRSLIMRLNHRRRNHPSRVISD